MNEVFNTAERVANTQASILLTGETGTGKEVLAKYIHDQSSRAKKPFVHINCASIPENLLESELFGYQRGAFPGAWTDKPGLLIQGNGGTIFFDEIVNMSSRWQMKLLRFLQECTIQPLGAVKTIKLDVRILAATNLEIQKALKSGFLRQDLYYRLNTIHLKIPPLRERKEDIPALAAHFVCRYNQVYNSEVQGLSQVAIEIIKNKSWPGNIRELENDIHRAVIFAQKGYIHLGHLRFDLSKSDTNQIKYSHDSQSKVEEKKLFDAISKALTLPSGESQGYTRLGLSVPLEQMVEFFHQIEERPFPPREFADHITHNSSQQRNKLANSILRALCSANILKHNSQKAQAARYSLNPSFLKFSGDYLGGIPERFF